MQVHATKVLLQATVEVILISTSATLFPFYSNLLVCPRLPFPVFIFSISVHVASVTLSLHIMSTDTLGFTLRNQSTAKARALVNSVSQSKN